jgi:hypothetical protein
MKNLFLLVIANGREKLVDGLDLTFRYCEQGEKVEILVAQIIFPCSKV